MTDMSDSTAQPTSTKSPMRTIIIVVVALAVLAGGAFVAYKLTNKRDTGEAAFTVAQRVEKALIAEDSATIKELSTAQGRAQLEKLDPADLTGFDFTGCVPTAVKTRLCLFARPGGELRMTLTVPGDKLLVNQAEIVAAGLPPGLPPATQTPPTT